MNEPRPTESLPGGQASNRESTRPLASVLRVDQCQRWTRGERIQVEEYLQQYPSLQLDREGVLDLIYNEVVLRERENETPQLEEYLQRFPQFAVQLRHQFDVHQVLEASRLPAAAKTPSEEVPTLNSPKAAPEDRWTAAGYEILREVGRGGMGIVYQAFDQKRAERVALKTLQRMSPAALYRFKQEFRALADVAHPNLVNLYELISDGQTWFFTMEFVEGVNFLAYVRSGANLLDSETIHDLAQAAGAAPADPGVPADLAPTQLGRLRDGLAQLAEAVSALHDAGKLHRDIKPSNVLVTKEGRVVLLDFGLATELDQSGLHQSAEQRVMGTAAYMAPEQAAGLSVSAASDWYSVGVVLYEALTGRRPFRGKSLQVLMDKQRFEPPAPSELLPGIPEDLDCLCRELLRRRPEERPRGPEIRRRLQRTTALANAPLCPRMPPAQASAFVGRARHLAALTEAFLASKQRRTVAVYVHGRSGLGKSALVQRFLDGLVERDEAVVLAGRCYERESVPYKALDSLIDALTRYLARLPRLEVETLLPRDVLPLARVFPVLREIEAVAAAPRRAFESFDARELRRRAFAALRELLARLGDRKPLVLAIDDLQWGDVDSAMLLANLLEPPDPPVLLLVGCYRSEEEASPVLQILKPRGRTDATVDQRELAVDVLTEAEAQDLARMLLGQDDPPTAAHAAAIARESGGNPFFVYELVRYLRTGAEPANRSSPAETVALDKVLWTRVLGLPEPARRLLEVVAVAGRPLRQTDACRGANLTGDDRALLAVLRAGHMVRRTSPGESEEIETYHDRIRETVVAHLAADTLKTHHGRLAVTLETSGKADPETLAVHFRGAEDPEKAGHYYALAADKAAEALAFVRAAGLYRLSLELRPLEEAAAREMRLKLGDALANAGHGPEAAREYQAASLSAGADERLDLQRRAAYQYLISGHFDEGHAALETVLRAVDMKLPATPRRALLSLIAHRAWLRIRGLGFRKRDAAQIPAAELRRLDICWSTSIGLAIIDIIRAADFQTRGMLLALKAGDPLRIIRALAIEAIHMAAGGGRTRRRTATLLGETEKLAQQLAHPYAEGVATLAQGAVAWLQGNHRTGWRLSAQAEEIFRNRCTGIAWELDAAQLYWLLSLVYLGEYAELSRLAPGMLKEAQERGDLFAATSLNAFMMPNLLLGADNPDGARQTTRAALAKWSQHGFHTQHLLALVSEVEVDLYRGEGAAAWARLKSHWPAYTGSLMTRVQHPHIQVLYSRARSALAAAASAGDPAALLRSAAKDARRLEREKMPWSLALAGLIRAGLAAARGDLDGSRARLAQAIPDLDRVEMGLQAAAARRRLGHLLGGDEGRTLVDQADARMAAQGIRNPARMTAALAPGFPA